MQQYLSRAEGQPTVKRQVTITASTLGLAAAQLPHRIAGAYQITDVREGALVGTVAVRDFTFSVSAQVVA